MNQSLTPRNSALSFSIAFGSGILMALATAPLNWWWLAWVALAPLWVIVQGEGYEVRGTRYEASKKRETGRDTQAKRQGNKETIYPLTSHLSPLTYAFMWGLGYHGLALFWITGLHPLMWMGVPWLASVAIALFCWVFITLWGAGSVVIWSWLMRKVGQGNRRAAWEENTPQSTIQNLQSKIPSSFILHPLSFRILLGTAVWCGLESLRSLTFLDWTSLSYTQSPGNPIILHLGQLSGPMMVTAAIVAVNGLLAEAWMSYQRSMVNYRQQAIRTSFPIPYLVIALSLLVTLHAIGFGLYNRPLNHPQDTALKVGIVQGNIPTRIKLFAEGLRRAEEGYTKGYEALADQGVEAVLTPEGALPYIWNQPNKVRSPFYQSVVQRNVVAWLGTFTAEDGRIARSLLTLVGSGEAVSRYNKVKLVPLGEYVPFQEIVGGLIGILSPVEENGLPGTLDQRFDTPFGRVIASICYDSAFPEVFRGQAIRGGQFILTASNLDPYSEVLMAQHEAQDLMRAIETDRWAVRATNTGYSGVIDPHGQIVWRSQPNTYQIYADTIYRRQTQTLYVRWGDWLTWLLLGLAAIAAVFWWRSPH